VKDNSHEMNPQTTCKTMKKNKIDEIETYLLKKYEIRINIITNTIEKRQKGSKEPFEPINENDLKYGLYKAGYSRFDGELKTILGSFIIPKYDPFKEYFEGLKKWDSSQPDYIQQLTTFVKTDDQRWFELMFKKMLVRVVFQALGSNQFNKHCFTFVGKQHDGKTSFFDFLVLSLFIIHQSYEIKIVITKFTIISINLYFTCLYIIF
jgi:predicted P-loop ATPase